MKKQLIHRIFSDIPRITTERLILRKMNVSDAVDMYEYAGLDKTVKYLSWEPHDDINYTHQYLRYLETRYRAGDFYDWGVILASENKLIGTCGFTRFDFKNDSAELGYVINSDYCGKGIATEACAAIIRYGFESLALNRIECRFIPENLASRRVMEKNGMTFEGIRRGGMLIKGEYRDIGICSILKDEYFKDE